MERQDGAPRLGGGEAEGRSLQPDGEEAHGVEEAVERGGGVVAEARAHTHDPAAEVDAANAHGGGEECHARWRGVRQVRGKVLGAEHEVDVAAVEQHAVLQDVDDAAVGGLLADHTSGVRAVDSRLHSSIHGGAVGAHNNDAVVDISETGEPVGELRTEAHVHPALSSDAHEHGHCG